MKNTLLSVGIIGIRGIHVSYSGFETLATELSSYLAHNGFRVIVYNRASWKQEPHETINNIHEYHIPTTKSKYGESFLHSLFATFHVILTQQADVILYLGVGNAPFTVIPRICGIKTVLNIDGLDWKRKKWNMIGRMYLKLCEWLSQWLPSKTITDTLYVQSYFQSTYGPLLEVIPNGVSPLVENSSTHTPLNISPGSYSIWCGRMVPDNNIEEVIDAFKRSPLLKKLVIVGDDMYDPQYVKRIHSLIQDDERFIYTGFIPNHDYLVLLRNAYAYIETKRSGGSHPSLIQAVGQGCLIVANSHPSIREITQNEAIYYEEGNSNDLAQILLKIESFNDSQYMKIKATQCNKINMYSWTRVGKEYASLLKDICKR